jgi:linoleoyl-CoA desaturase
VKELCGKYDIPYTIGPLHRQYGQALRTIIKLSLPNKMTSSDQPEPPGPVRERKRKSDAERPPRRPELGGWSRTPRSEAS